MIKLNKKGITVVETVMTFALILIISAGLLSIIMNYRQKVNIEMKRVELVTFKNTLTKEIQTDISTYGVYEINKNGLCLENNEEEFSDCINIVFKNGVEKILAVSKIDDNDIEKLNNKYIKYGNTKHLIEDKLPEKIPVNRDAKDFQNIYINSGNILSVDSVVLSDGTNVKLYSIDIYMEHINYEDDFGIHIVASNNDALSTSNFSKDFDYSESNNSAIVYTIPANGTYKLELWGASGGNKETYQGGLGAYVSGYTYLNKGTVLYLYIGGSGSSNTEGGYNGGGSIMIGQENYGSPGGGATDIRTVGGNWNDFDSLKSRIMVAAGGGGANNRNYGMSTTIYGAGDGGAGGGLIGYDGESINYNETGYTSSGEHSYGTGGRQNTGGSTNTYNNSNTLLTSNVTGGFGITSNISQSGAGGGWFTGGISSSGGAGGGSSYISGHEGCLAIDQSSTSTNIIMKDNSIFDGYYFNNTIIIDGNGYAWTTEKQEQTTMPSYDGKTDAVGNNGNGHIRITYLGL